MEIKSILKKNAPFIVTFVFCICIVSTIYSNALNGEFIFDDRSSITENYSIRMNNITFGSILTSIKSNRPIPMLSFAINYYFHGYNVQGYHIVNILIHIINSILVFFLCRKLLIISDFRTGWKLSWLPVLTACLWAVNPVHTQSVTYIVQRMTSMATMFYLASFVSYLTARTSTDKKTVQFFIVLSVISGISAVLSKEMAVTLPVFILLYEWLFFRGADTRLIKKYKWHIVSIFILIPVAGYFFVHYFYSNFTTSEYANYNFNMLQRCLTQPRVIIYYVGLMLFPHPSRLNIDYDFPVSHSIFDPFTTLIAIFVTLVSITGSIYLIFKKDKDERSINKLIAFSIFWYFGNLLIESSVIPLDMVFEHRTYLPSTLLFLTIVLLLSNAIKNRIMLVTLTIVGILCCSFWTFNRNFDWQTRKSIWLDAVSKSPNKGRPYLNIGTYYADKKDIETAIQYYSTALTKETLLRTRLDLYMCIGKYYYDLEQYHTALEYFNKVFAIKNNHINAISGIGSVLFKLKQYDNAAKYLSEVIKIKPNDTNVHTILGEMYLEQNILEKALEHYNIALKIEPNHPVNNYNRGDVYYKIGKTDLAIKDFNKAKALDNNIVQAYIMLGVLYTDSKQYKKAVLEFERALKIDESCIACHEYWAALLFKTRDFEGAIFHYKKIIEIDPKNMKAYKNIGTVFFNNRDIFNALVNLNKALQLKPDNKETKQYYNLVSNSWQQSHLRERTDIVEKYITVNKKEPFAFAELGRLFYANNDYEKSIENWNHFLGLLPESFVAMNHIAVCHMIGKNYMKAVEMYKKMLVIQPDNQIIYYNLACAYSSSGKYKQSINTLKSAVGKGFSDFEDMKKDPDLSNALKSRAGKKFLLTINNK